jgi:hypothetical protein
MTCGRVPRTPSGRFLVLALVLITGSALLSSCARLARPARPTGPPTYYLSPSGNNDAAGTSPATAWRTLGRASAAIFPPGSRLLLQGGRRFSGRLTLGARDAGEAARPVRISSYGEGWATIGASGGVGIAVNDTAGVEISNLTITGTSSKPVSGAGINVYSDLHRRERLDLIRISQVDVSGFSNGIAVGAANGAVGFRDVSVSDSVLHGNLDAGLQTYGTDFAGGAPVYANESVSVSHVVAYRNPGDPADHAASSGSGIILGSVRDGSVSWSVAYDNGGLGRAHEGPEGIWTYNSTGIVIQHNISYDNRTHGAVDGNGLGLDQNTSYSYLQYNISYGNDGAGYLIYGPYNNGQQTHNVVRFNISSGNGRDGNPKFAGIDVSGIVSDTAVYANTVIARSSPSKPSPDLVLSNQLHGVTIRDNILMTQGGPIVFAKAALRPASALLQGNDYYSSSAAWSVLWGSDSYASLSDWRSASGQETRAGKPTGFAVDPELTGPVLGLRATTVGEADAGFALRPGSALIRAGLPPPGLHGLQPALRNYAGGLVATPSPDVGAE